MPRDRILGSRPEASEALREEARRLLAYEDISGDIETSKRLDEIQRKQLEIDTKKAGRELKEVVWRTHKNVERLAKDNTLQGIDLGLIHSSAAGSLTELIINRLISQDEITQAVGPSKLIKYWPPGSRSGRPRLPAMHSFRRPPCPDY